MPARRRQVIPCLPDHLGATNYRQVGEKRNGGNPCANRQPRGCRPRTTAGCHLCRRDDPLWGAGGFCALLLMGLLPLAGVEDPDRPPRPIPLPQEAPLDQDPPEVQGPVIIFNLDDDEVQVTVPPGFGGQRAGRAVPEGPPPAARWELTWSGSDGVHRSVLVVEPGITRCRPAWIATEDGQGQLQVAYGGRAFTDAGGVVHVDARASPCNGPHAGSWSPDSIAINAQGQVALLDDAERGSAGKVLARHDFTQPDPQPQQMVELARIRFLVEGCL